MKETLVILAAGMGSRFGGLKQIEPIDQYGNFIIDYSVYDAIEAEVGGKNRKLLKGLLFAVITPAQWFAKKCYKAIQGVSGNNSTLFRVLISRAEIDMYAIRDYYLMDTNNEIKNDLEDDTNGAYGQILVNLSLK